MVQTAAKPRPVELKVLGGKKLAIAVSRFNEAVCEGLLTGALGALKESGVTTEHIEVFRVPGAFEIPLVAKKLAQSGRFAGVIALGAVIRGETPHFEFVSLAATMGCLQAALDTGCPVLFGVLTVNNEAEAAGRSRPDEFNKGREAVLALFDVLKTM